MPTKPAYQLHKHTGQARVRIDGRDHYLGTFNSEESRLRYDDLIADWRMRQEDQAGMTIADLSILYIRHARKHYRKDEVETSEVNCIRQALRPLVAHAADVLCRKFGPKKLREVREKMIGQGLCRNVINIHVGRIRRMFKWAVSEEMIAETVYRALLTLPGLEQGRSDARESEPVRPVAKALIDAVKPFVSRQVLGMIQLQIATGMRPGEVLQIRGIDINMAGRIWEYEPRSHKTSHHGKRRIIFIGPKGQKIIRQFLKPDLQAHLFNPREARAEFVAKHYRKGAKVADRFPVDHFTIEGYETAIRRACERAHGMPPHLAKIDRKLPADQRADLKRQAAEWRRQWCWHPHQLRHNAGTDLRRQFGLEATRTVLGHSTVSATEIYAEADLQKARDIMATVG